MLITLSAAAAATGPVLLPWSRVVSMSLLLLLPMTLGLPEVGVCLLSPPLSLLLLRGSVVCVLALLLLLLLLSAGLSSRQMAKGSTAKWQENQHAHMNKQHTMCEAANVNAAAGWHVTRQIAQRSTAGWQPKQQQQQQQQCIHELSILFRSNHTSATA
jgi:hypothetical protein